MIKKKPAVSFEIKDAVEHSFAKSYVDQHKYVILNSFVTFMRLNYNLNYTNKRAIEILNGFNLKRKRVAFDTVSGIKHSKNEFINELGFNKTKPIIIETISHDQTIEKVALLVLSYIKDHFEELNFSKGIINFNLFNSENGLTLVFDNRNLKEVLRLLINKFSYDLEYIPVIASKIRSLSEPSYIRENEYTERSIHVNDKKFYSYTFKGETNV